MAAESASVCALLSVFPAVIRMRVVSTLSQKKKKKKKPLFVFIVMCPCVLPACFLPAKKKHPPFAIHTDIVCHGLRAHRSCVVFSGSCYTNKFSKHRTFKTPICGFKARNQVLSAQKVGKEFL